MEVNLLSFGIHLTVIIFDLTGAFLPDLVKS